jgi:aspartyl-tRNA synthetase
MNYPAYFQVTVAGWIQNARMDNKFIVLRDHQGLVQVVLDDELEDSGTLRSAPLESSICIEGIVTQRPQGHDNDKMDTGQVEVKVNPIY